MASSYRQGFVFVQNIFSGIIRETDSGYEFEYDKKYLASQNPVAVSLTLPLQEEIFESKSLFSFFDGLIPEGWLLNIVSKNWKILLPKQSLKDSQLREFRKNFLFIFPRKKNHGLRLSAIRQDSF